eukprot:scaffold1247_cov251-Pinguiococcus_pyrenoidosus.AAC.28
MHGRGRTDGLDHVHRGMWQRDFLRVSFLASSRSCWNSAPIHPVQQADRSASEGRWVKFSEIPETVYCTSPEACEIVPVGQALRVSVSCPVLSSPRLAWSAGLVSSHRKWTHLASSRNRLRRALGWTRPFSSSSDQETRTRPRRYAGDDRAGRSVVNGLRVEIPFSHGGYMQRNYDR